MVPDTPPSQLVQRLELWTHDPLTTLKINCNLPGVKGSGKTDKEGFYTSALWLHEHHPKTLACNVNVIASFGYFKVFLEILFKIIQGHDARSKIKQEWAQTCTEKENGKFWNVKEREIRSRSLGDEKDETEGSGAQ